MYMKAFYMEKFAYFQVCWKTRGFWVLYYGGCSDLGRFWPIGMGHGSVLGYVCLYYRLWWHYKLIFILVIIFTAFKTYLLHIPHSYWCHIFVLLQYKTANVLLRIYNRKFSSSHFYLLPTYLLTYFNHIVLTECIDFMGKMLIRPKILL